MAAATTHQSQRYDAITMRALDTMRSCSPEIEQVCMPFDAKRSALLRLGEFVAALHALRRGAFTYGEVVGKVVPVLQDKLTEEIPIIRQKVVDNPYEVAAVAPLLDQFNKLCEELLAKKSDV